MLHGRCAKRILSGHPSRAFEWGACPDRAASDVHTNIRPNRDRTGTSIRRNGHLRRFHRRERTISARLVNIRYSAGACVFQRGNCGCWP
jgi:hypothetical protein